MVPNGVVESWFSCAVGPRGKTEWLAKAFAALGDNPGGQNMVPTDDDVWEFVRSISRWITNPNRRGHSKGVRTLLGDHGA